MPVTVKFCTECGLKMEDEKKNESYKTAILIITVVIFMLMAAVIVGVFKLIGFAGNSLDEQSASASMSKLNLEDIEGFPDGLESEKQPKFYEEDEKNDDGYYPYGTYEIGDEIPEGEYLLYAADFITSSEEKYAVARFDINSDREGNNQINGAWFEYSRYVKLDGNDYLELSWCDAYDTSLCKITNSPFEHPGMFKVGVDLKPGTYKLKEFSDQMTPQWIVHNNLESIDESAIHTEGFYGVDENSMVTVEVGQYLEMSQCILEEID